MKFSRGRAPQHAVPFTIPTVSHKLACFAFLLASLLSTLYLLPSSPASAAPTTMNFQGRLADSSGNVMTNGLYNMQFRLFTVASGGAATWTETRETTNRVQVTNGLFSVQLGAVTPLSASLFSGNDVYFEITMPTPGTATCSIASCASWESAMTPRHKMATSAYAFQSENANTLDGLDSTAFAQLSSNNTFTGTNTVSSTNATAFRVQNASTVAVLTADTSNLRIQVGSSTTDSTAVFFLLDQYDQASDPANTINGAMYYNTSLNKLRCYQNGAWADCAGASTSLNNLTATSINQSLIAGSNNTLDIGSSANTWRSGYFGTSLNTPVIRPLADSATALQIQNTAGSTTILTVNTSSNNVLIGTGTDGVTIGSTGIVLAGTSRADKTISLAPEYAGATFTPDGSNNVGSLSSDFCSGSSRQNINTTVCAATDTRNYYQWTTDQASVQDYDIYVRYQMPSDYSTGSMTNMKIWGWGTTSANEIVTVSLISDASATPCSTSSDAASTNATWNQVTVASPLGACTPAAGDWVTFKVRVAAGQNNFARAGEINFDYKRTR